MTEAEKTEKYWQEFYIDVERMLLNWQQQYNPEGDWSILELINRGANADSHECTPETMRASSGGFITICRNCRQVLKAELTGKELQELLAK